MRRLPLVCQEGIHQILCLGFRSYAIECGLWPQYQRFSLYFRFSDAGAPSDRGPPRRRPGPDGAPMLPGAPPHDRVAQSCRICLPDAAPDALPPAPARRPRPRDGAAAAARAGLPGEGRVRSRGGIGLPDPTRAGRAADGRGAAPFGADGQLSMTYLLGADAGRHGRSCWRIVVWRIRAGGERVSDVLLGRRPWGAKAGWASASSRSSSAGVVVVDAGAAHRVAGAAQRGRQPVRGAHPVAASTRWCSARWSSSPAA